MDVQTFLLLIVFTFLLAICGVGLYRAASVEKNKWIFIALFALYIFIMPLAALLSLTYVFYFAKKRLTIAEVRSWFASK